MSGMSAVTELEGRIGRKLDVVHFYQAWGGRWKAFDRRYLSFAGGDRAVMLSWEPWAPGGPADQADFSLESILSPRYVGYITTWAGQLRSYGHTVYLRPMHEMNGNWYPWSGGVNGNSASLYRRAWRHIHEIFDDAGATEVRWVWSPYAQDIRSADRFEAYFPDASDVDVLALDGYNWGTCRPEYGGWRSFDRIFRSHYERIAKLADRPVWIAETASTSRGGDKAAWVTDMFEALKRNYPKVAAVIWFDADKECDWSLDATAALGAVRAGLAAP
jgi:beta-mannanase